MLTADFRAVYTPSGEGFEFKDALSSMRKAASASETGGLYSVWKVVLQPGFMVPPHIHEVDDELFMIQSGQLQVTVADKVIVAGPGDTVFGPRGIMHSIETFGDVPVELFLVATGTNFEEFYPEWFDAINPEFNPELASKVATKYHIVIPGLNG